jgi:hypothetical protein
MTSSDRTYHTFEEFERDDLRRFEAPGSSVDDMLDAIFGPASEVRPPRSGRSEDEDDESRNSEPEPREGSGPARLPHRLTCSGATLRV